jgi:hypothetical protein
MNAEVWIAFITGIFGILTVIIKAIVDKRKGFSRAVKLGEHPFFARMQLLRRHITTTFCLPNRGKQEVFKEILTNKIDATTAALKAAIPDIEKCASDDGTRLYNIHMEALQQSIRDFQQFYKNDRYTEDEQRALETVLQKFNKWNAERVDYMTETIQMVCSSPFYADCRTKASVLFDLYIGLFIDTLNDAERTLNELNGDLTGLTFKGIVI